MQVVQAHLQIQRVTMSIFHVILGTRLNFLIYYQSEDPCAY